MTQERYEPVIGLEVHAQLSTRTKIFCGCSTQFGAPPNSQVCPVCLGLPGVLPVLNQQVVEFALRLGLACGCRINPASIFARKNYFYPDLPKNYQISQYDQPLCEAGHVDVMVGGQPRQVRLVRIHLEEDAGKSLHDQTAGDSSLVDLNRCGVPLVEIVGEPDLRHPEEAGAYLTALRQLVRWLGICDGNMEEGSLRCDANVSIRPRGATAYGTRCEIKNLNSIRGVVAALEHEIARQAKLLDAGAEVEQQTRAWDAARGITVFMRGKEHAHDYRYFPDPDLVPLRIDPGWLARVRAQLPELPAARTHRLMEQYGLPAYDAQVLTDSSELADYYEAVVRATGDAKPASNWMMAEVLRLLNERNESIAAFPVPPAGVADLLNLVRDGAISGKLAKEVFDEMVATGATAEAIVARRGLRQISDAEALGAEISRIFDANPGNVQAYLGGKEGLLGYFVGQLMKATRGQANPQLANQLVKAALERRRSQP